MKSIIFKIFTSVFISSLFFAPQIFAQNTATFPLTHSHLRQDSVIKVTLKNNTAINYTARVSLADNDLQSTYGGGNNYQYVLLTPGAEQIFSFSNIVANRTYKANMVATKDAQPNLTTSIFFQKEIIIKPTSSTPTPQTPTGQGTAQPGTMTPAVTPATAPPAATNATPASSNTIHQCNDHIDNDGDGRADWDGNMGGGKFVEPDPNCFTTGARSGLGLDGNAVKEEKDDVARNDDGTLKGLIPCTNKCTFTDVFRLINGLLTFFITTLLIPIFIIMIIYAGYKYIMAQGNSSKIANLKGMLWHLVGGIILILCSWLIVHTIMTTLLNDEYKSEGIEFLGQ